MAKNTLYYVLLLSCLFGSSFCGKPKQPDYIDFQNLKLNKAGLNQSVVTFDLRYFNPNNYKLQLKQAAVDVYFNDKYVGHSSLDSLIQVPAKDTFMIPVSMQVDMKSLVKNAVQLLMNPDVMVKLTGNAKVGKGGVFLNVPINYEGKQRIDIFARDSSRTMLQ